LTGRRADRSWDDGPRPPWCTHPRKESVGGHARDGGGATGHTRRGAARRDTPSKIHRSRRGGPQTLEYNARFRAPEARGAVGRCAGSDSAPIDDFSRIKNYMPEIGGVNPARPTDRWSSVKRTSRSVVPVRMRPGSAGERRAAAPCAGDNPRESVRGAEVLPGKTPFSKNGRPDRRSIPASDKSGDGHRGDRRGGARQLFLRMQLSVGRMAPGLRSRQNCYAMEGRTAAGRLVDPRKCRDGEFVDGIARAPSTSQGFKGFGPRAPHLVSMTHSAPSTTFGRVGGASAWNGPAAKRRDLVPPFRTWWDPTDGRRKPEGSRTRRNPMRRGAVCACRIPWGAGEAPCPPLGRRAADSTDPRPS